MTVGELDLGVARIDGVLGGEGVTGESQGGDGEDGVFFHGNIL